MNAARGQTIDAAVPGSRRRAYAAPEVRSQRVVMASLCSATDPPPTAFGPFRRPRK